MTGTERVYDLTQKAIAMEITIVFSVAIATGFLTRNSLVLGIDGPIVVFSFFFLGIPIAVFGVAAVLYAIFRSMELYSIEIKRRGDAS